MSKTDDVEAKKKLAREILADPKTSAFFVLRLLEEARARDAEDFNELVDVIAGELKEMPAHVRQNGANAA